MKLNKSKIDEEIYYYVLKTGEKRFLYRHKYYDVLGKRKEKKKSGFITDKDALKALLEVKSAILNGQFKQVEESKMTVSNWLDIWYETYNNGWGVKTKERREDIIKHQIKPLLGKCLLTDLDKSTYKRKYINPLLKKYKPGSVRLFHRIFCIAINAAVDDEILIRNRFKNIKIEMDDKLENFLTPQELNTFLDVAKTFNPTRYTMVMLLAYTGLRKGEAQGLKWNNVDFTNKKITIAFTRDKHGERPPKTKNSYRTISIDDKLIKQLERYKKWCVEIKFKNGMKLDKKKDYVFISALTGEPIGETLLYQTFRNIYKKIKEDKLNIKEITPHGLRHTHATVLINNGVPPKTVANRLGNTVEMVYTVYSHSFDEMEEKAVSIFSNSLSGANTGAK